MPPTGSSRKDNPQLKALDKESKRARGALSCAECRRLKLKCDKTVPCASCKRRGCSAICPNGSLITGQGTRFVLADTEKLHQKIAQMSDRIRQLEDALQILQSTLSSEPHPLLVRELLKIKSSIELHAAVDDDMIKTQASGSSSDNKAGGIEEEEPESVIDSFGTLAIRDDGAATFYGRSAGSESLLIGETLPTGETPLIPSSTLPPDPSASPLATYGITTSPPHLPSSNNYPQATSPRQAIASLNASFPLSTNTFQNSHISGVIDMDYLLLHFLPKWEEAWRLSQLYLEQAPWFFGAVTKRQLIEEMLPMWYFEARGLAPGGQVEVSPVAGTVPLTPISPVDPQTGGRSGVMGQTANAPSPGSYSATSSSSSTTTQAPPGGNSSLPHTEQPKYRTRTAHDLALLFMIFCFGALTDVNLPPAPDNSLSEDFFQLTKAALVLEPVFERPPSVATVQTLSLIAIYEGICSRDGSVERTWGVFGVAVKLAQSIGLHRDCARWKLSPAEVQKRRALFWELFITDCWQSLATGRLATFSLPFVDCELPADPDSTIAEDGSVQPSFPYWKARFGAECVSAVVQGTLTSRAPKYSIILDLDRKVRDMDLPIYAQQALSLDLEGKLGFSDLERAGEGAAVWGLALGETMSRFMPINYRELTLLYIHRCFFAHAIETHPADPIKSQYAPSFLAGYNSACTILGSVRKQFMLFPRQIARFWVLWTHAFSATVMLSSVATHVSKQSQVAHAAMIELNNACELFEHASRQGGRAVKFLPILTRLRKKAQKSFEDSERGLPPSIPNDILKPSKTDEEKNEMEIFGGKTHTVATRVPATNGLRKSASTASLESLSRGSSGSPKIKPLAQGYLQVPGQAPGLPPNVQGMPSNMGVFAGMSQPLAQPGPSVANQTPVQQQQQQQQLITQYPSFEGVHPSLVHELRGFGGRIDAQVKQAYIDTSVPEAPRPVEENNAGYQVYNLPGPIQEEQEVLQMPGGMEDVQYHQQREIEQQQHIQQLEMERERRREDEQRRRAEIERQEQEYQLERERVERREREYEMRARQQQQQYHPPPPRPPSTFQQPQQHPQSQHGGYYTQEPPPPPPPQVRPRSSESTLRQAYVHGQDMMYNEGQFTPTSTHYQQPPRSSGQPQQQQPLHVIPPQQYLNGRESLATPISGVQTPSVTPYDAQAPCAHYPPPQQISQPQPPQPQPQPQPQQGYLPETYSQYWAAAPSIQNQGYAQQQQQQVQYSGQPPYHQVQGQPQQPQQQYTPTGALRGIAADDTRLQETWTTYMYNVGSPRTFFED